MAAGLLVARPTLVVPSFGDLFMWGVRRGACSPVLCLCLLACVCSAHVLATHHFIAVPAASKKQATRLHRHTTDKRAQTAQHAAATQDLCHRLGVGPPPLPLDRLDESSLATGLRDLAAGARPGGSYAAAAQEVSRGLAREDGLAAAVASVLRDA